MRGVEAVIAISAEGISYDVFGCISLFSETKETMTYHSTPIPAGSLTS